MLLRVLEEVPRAVETLAPLVDYTARINTDDTEPVLEGAIPGGQGGGTSWQAFRTLWEQTCIDEESFPLAKLINLPEPSSNLQKKPSGVALDRLYLEQLVTSQEPLSPALACADQSCEAVIREPIIMKQSRDIDQGEHSCSRASPRSA